MCLEGSLESRGASWLSGFTDGFVTVSFYKEKQELLSSRRLGMSQNLRGNTFKRESRAKVVNLSDCGKLRKQVPNSGRKAQSRAMSLLEHEEKRYCVTTEFKLHMHPCQVPDSATDSHPQPHFLIINYKRTLTFQIIHYWAGKISLVGKTGLQTGKKKTTITN